MYKAGIRVNYDSSEIKQSVKRSVSMPLYIGFAPIHYLDDYTRVVNKAIQINDSKEAIEKLGYCDDWEHYTLCPAIHAHFMGDDNIGPVLFLNVFDPNAIKSGEKNKALTFTNGETTLEDATNVITNTITIDGKVQGEDFVVMRSTDGTTVRIVSTNKGNLTGQQTVKWYEVQTDNLTKNLIKGARIKGGDSTGVWAIDSAYREYNVKPNIVCVPKFSRETDVKDEILKILQNYGEEYRLYGYVDIPCSSSTATTDTIEGVKTWKKSSTYNNKNIVSNWGTYVVGDKKYPSSIIRTKVAQMLDSTTEIPCKVPSNYILGTGKLVSDEGKELRLGTAEGIELDSVGISTIVYAEGAMRTWGTKTSRYNVLEEDSIDPRDTEEIRVRSVYAIGNNFVSTFFDKLHSPLTIGLKENIKNTYQAYLDRLVTKNEILYGVIEFDAYENTLDRLVKGEFYFKTSVTSGGNLNYIDLRIKWTDKGYEKFFTPTEGGAS